MAKGSIERLKTGYRAKVYAGRDPVTKRQTYLRGPTRREESDAAADVAKLLKDAEAERYPDRAATVAQLLDKWFEIAELELYTRTSYEGYIRRTLKPHLGDLPVRKLAARVDILDRLYKELRRCTKLCDGTLTVDHRTSWPHECRVIKHHKRAAHDCAAVGCRIIECKPHACRPAQVSTIRQINSILSAAYGYAITWGWAERNPASLAHVPRQKGRKRARPQQAGQVAALLNLAFEVLPEFGLYLWLAATTGARRGELAALRWSDVDLDRGLLLLDENYVVTQGQKKVKGTKTDEPRPLSLDTLSVAMLRDLKAGRETTLREAKLELRPEAYVFSPEPDGSRPWNPDTYTHRYERLAKQIGITEPLKNLRHFSATQLLAGGVDLRTTAGRLGHADGGVTTLRFYADFIRPADQRAAEMLAQDLHRLRNIEEAEDSGPTATVAASNSTRKVRRQVRRTVVRVRRAGESRQ